MWSSGPISPFTKASDASSRRFMNCAKSCESFFNIFFNVQVGTRNNEYMAEGVQRRTVHLLALS